MTIKSISMIILFFVFSLCLACSSNQYLIKGNKIPEQHFKQSNIEQDSYKIYSTVINDHKNKDGYVIQDKSETYWLPYKNLSEAIENIFQDQEEIIDPKVLTSFLMENNEAVNFKAQFELDYPYILVIPEKLSEIFENGGWNNFQRLYPKRSFIKLSRIGYNIQKDKALVYISSSGGSKAGSGDYYILEKQGKDWIIVREINAWVS